jgi:dGTPase
MANHSAPEWKPCEHFEGNEEKCRLGLFAGHCSCKGRRSIDYYRDMINNYTTLKDSELPAWSFEAYIVSAADEIAQRHHDLEDSLVTRITSPQEVVEILNENFRMLLKGERYREDRLYLREIGDFVKHEHRPNQESAFVPYVSRFILNLLKKRLIYNSNEQLNLFYKMHGIYINNQAQKAFEKVFLDISCDHKKQYEHVIDYDPECKIIDEKLHDFLKKRVLNSFHAQRMDGVGTI